MKEYLRVEIDGEVANSGALISELREREYPVSIDNEGYLLVSLAKWKELEEIASRHRCELYNPELTRQAA